MTTWKRQNYGDDWKISGCQAEKGRRWTGGAQTHFRVVKIICMLLWWWIYISLHICPNPLNVHQEWASPQVKYGLGVIVMCQCRFVPDEKWAILVSDVYNEGSYACMGQGVFGKSLYLPLSFVVNLFLRLYFLKTPFLVLRLGHPTSFSILDLQGNVVLSQLWCWPYPFLTTSNHVF